MKHRIILAIVVLALSVCKARTQDNVFTLFQKESSLADTYFMQRQYKDALDLYQKAGRKSNSPDTYLKLARCYYFLKQYDLAVVEYERFSKSGSLVKDDLYYYAEALVSTSQVPRALEAFRQFQHENPDHPIVMEKIWRLDNIQYVFEDSIHYSVRPVSINTTDGELYPVRYQNDILFLSNRKEVQVIQNVDGSRKTPFYRFFKTKVETDSVRLGLLRYEEAMRIELNGDHKMHAGPLYFYNKYSRMVYTKTSEAVSRSGERSLQIFFADQVNGKWVSKRAFPFNSPEYSNSDPWISEDGNTLYFSSNRPGGFGGMDLYKSEFQNNRWAAPENLGELINTPYDERSPHLHKSVLYFSSNGHPGIGGLDIFRCQLDNTEFGEVQLMGFPLNSPGDDFGLYIDSTGTNGYLTSNRLRYGFDDDIYEFDMDLQTYPLTIDGLLQLKEVAWADSVALVTFAHADIELIDNVKNVVVFTTRSGVDGKFSISIPKFSSYRVRVVGAEGEEHVVSLDIPKHKREHSGHNIVIVKDAFRSLK